MYSFHRAGATRKPLVILVAGLMLAAATFAEHDVAAAAATTAPSVAAAPPEIAATVDGTPIPVSRVRELALQEAGPTVLDQLIGNVLIDREAGKRHITVTASEVDERIDRVRQLMKPNGLEASLRARHMSLGEMREQIRVQIEFEKLIGPTLPPVTMSHIADNFISAQPGAADAQSTLENLRQRLRAGASFEELARTYSGDPETKALGGDIGILTNAPNSAVNPVANSLCAQPGFREAALNLKRGEVAVVPATPNGGYHLIKALSTAADHDVSENGLYAAAHRAAREAQFGIEAPGYVQSLRRRNQVVVYMGKHVPGRATVAAVVDGDSIPLTKVEDLAYRTAGESVVRHLIDVLLVHQEARRQKIVVSTGEVDARIASLRRNMGPTSFASMLRDRQMSLDEFRDTVRVELESYHLVWKSLGPLQLAHVRHIFLLTNPDAASRFPGAKPHSESEARTLMAHIQMELRAGKKFGELAKEYSDDAISRASGGDLGVILPESRFGGEIYHAASALKPGEITPHPIASDCGLHLILAVSTRADHSLAENALYARAVNDAHLQELQVFLRPYLQHLRSKSRIVDNLAEKDTTHPTPQPPM